MKHIHYLLLALVCGLFTACMDGDWDEPSFTGGAPFGNNEITEDGLITIAELIEKYPNVFASTDQNAQITENIKIKGRVTGNDIGGNIYKQIAIQDDTRAIIIAINEGGLNGFLAEGQEILIDLNGLYIGGYRKQPEIGAPYNGTSIGRMSKDVWASHFKIIGTPDPNAIQPVDFNTIKDDKDGNCAKLVTLKNVTFTRANGKYTFASKDANDPDLLGGSINRKLDGMDVLVRTSTYADFAAMPLPYNAETKKAKPCNITGIATRYNNDWQFLIRKASDIEVIEN